MGFAQQFDPLTPVRRGPVYAKTPLVLSVPHAGRFYPPDIALRRAVPQSVIESLEDRYVDLLIGPMVAAGAVAIVAPAARAWIDLNRAPIEDKDGRHARAGLGIVPTRIGGRALWHDAPDADEVAARVAAVHQPYHAMIAAALDEACARHGHALLLDCHSMPSIRRGPGAGATLVIGDRHGASADRAVSAAVAQEAHARGFLVSRNAPYAGAYTVEHHGRPRARRDAVQLEIDRSLYLTEDLREPGPRIGAVAEHLAGLARVALEAARPAPLLDAAE